MGANYFKIISSLIILKDDLSAIDEKKYHHLITLLQGFQICINDEDWKTPDKKEIAEKLNIPYSKALLLIRGLYEKLLGHYSDNVLEITEVEQEVQIYIPFDERENQKRYNDPDYLARYTRYLRVKMPVIPRIGEEICLDFIDRTNGVNRGYVHEIRHVLMGKRQIVEIFVHPFNDYYYKWKKMEVNYKDHELWLRRLRAENG